MKVSPILHNEEERLQAVYNLSILDTEPEERFDHITRGACEFFKVPMSTVTIIDKDREWFKSCQGTPTKENPREISFCAHAMLSDYIFIVEDTLADVRFADNPMVINPPHIRFYAGMVLKDRTKKYSVGVFCIKDTKPRTMTPVEIDRFIQFAREAESELNK